MKKIMNRISTQLMKTYQIGGENTNGIKPNDFLYIK